ncbi:MAG: tetratricopeptide repeat protein [Candidatus Neomarinimicrobiota bacterium]
MARIVLFTEGATSKFFNTMINLPWRCASIVLPVSLILSPLCGQETQAEVRQYDTRALSHFLDADLYMMQGDYGEAAAAYERALSYDSSSATIYLGLAEALLRQGQLERSRAAGEQAKRLQPDDPLVYEFLARNAAAREDLGEAVQHLDKWAELDPADLDPLFRKAGLLLQQKKFAEAIDAYLAIYDRDPLQEQVLPRAGEIAISIGDFERAYQVYQRLHQQRPDDPRITRTYAEISVQIKRYEEAAAAFAQLEESGEATLATTLQLAWLYLQLEDLDGAQSVLAPLVEQGHRQWDVLSLSGHVAEKLSDYEQLAAVSELMREVYPDSIGGYTGLAIARNYLEDRQGAVEVLEEAIIRFPDDADVNYLLGNLYFNTDRFAEAERCLLTALTQRPTASHIQHLLATTWSSLGKYAPSDSLYEVVLKADEDDAVAMNNYAYSIADRSQVSRRQLWYARKLSRKSLKLQPENAAFLDTYGWIWYRLKWYRTAHKYIARSVAIRPDSPVVLEHLGEVYLKLGKSAKAEEYFERAKQVRQQETPPMVRAQEE